MRSLGRSRRTRLSRVLFFSLSCSNVAGTGAYVKYRREVDGMKICCSSRVDVPFERSSARLVFLVAIWEASINFHTGLIRSELNSCVEWGNKDISSISRGLSLTLAFAFVLCERKKIAKDREMPPKLRERRLRGISCREIISLCQIAVASSDDGRLERARASGADGFLRSHGFLPSPQSPILGEFCPRDN